MVNYVLSFCKITGASKIFKRNFYLPLLKPLTPREALRTLRITGKWLLGAKIQHYIPVLLNHNQKRSKRLKNYGKKTHEAMDDFTYMTPVLDKENDNHKILLKILETKESNGHHVFVYTVEDKKYNIVLQTSFELAIRQGDIIDVLVSQKNDKIIVKMKDFKKIPMEIQYFEGNSEEMFCGEGATSQAEEKFHHHGKYTMSLAKMFEEKEMIEDKWEEELRKIMKRRKKQRGEGTKAWKEMVKQSIKNLDWQKFEEDAKQVIDDIEEPASEQLIQMEIDDLETTKNVNETILKRKPELLTQLPTLREIPEIIQNLGKANLTEISVESSEDHSETKVSGVKVVLPSGKECFVSGQMVHTEDGDVFVPGQTVENEYGSEYAPGITVVMDNKPALISGLIMGEERRDPMFLPTQSTITNDGQLTFATVPEERPPPQPDSQRTLRKQKIVEELEVLTDLIENQLIDQDEQPEDQIIICVESDQESVDLSSHEEDDKSNATSIELNNSEMEELDIEAIRLKQEQQKLELEKLKMILLDDGMDDLLASLEAKKAKLKQKLEELRNISLNSEHNLITYVNEADGLEFANKITKNPQLANRLSDIILVMIRRICSHRDRHLIRSENIHNHLVDINSDDRFSQFSNKLKVLFKTSLVAGNDVLKNRPKDQLMVLQAFSDILGEVLQSEDLLMELIDLMNTNTERNEVCLTALRQLSHVESESKRAILSGLANRALPPEDIFDTIEKILEKDSLISAPFVKVAKVAPEIVRYLIKSVKERLTEQVKTDEQAMEVLELSIVQASKILLNQSSHNGKDLQSEALSFAQALGLSEIVLELTDCPDSPSEKAQELIKRMVLMRLLAERDYNLKTAIERIKKNPECAKSDPRIRQLVRESAVLISDSPPIKTSRDIPIQLMRAQNLLAIEDFLIQRCKIDYPILVSRNGLEAVIPREAARGVLAGRVSYVLLDESGFTRLKPMHMMAAISVNQNKEKRIDDYLTGRRASVADPTFDEARSYRSANKNNGASDASWQNNTSRRTMSSAALSRGYTGPRA